MQPGQLLHWKFSPKEGFVTPGIEQSPKQPCSLVGYQHHGNGQSIGSGNAELVCGSRIFPPSSNLLKTFKPNFPWHHCHEQYTMPQPFAPLSCLKRLECSELLSLLPQTFQGHPKNCQLFSFSSLPVVTRLVVMGHSLEAQATICLAKWELAWMTLAPVTVWHRM